MSVSTNAIHLTDTKIPIVRLECKKHFDVLTPKERLYAHYLSRACFAGSMIASGTLSHQSPSLVNMLLKMFSVSHGKAIETNVLGEKLSKAGVTEQEYEYLLDYAGMVLDNSGNFRSYGYTKIIPRISQEKFQVCAKETGCESEYNTLKDYIYGMTPESSLLLGFPKDGFVSGYYSENMSKQDAEFVSRFLTANNIIELNTRVFKTDEKSYEVKVASAIVKESQTHDFEGTKITVSFGDFNVQLEKVANNAEKAIEYCANDNQKLMLEKYVESFRTGSMEAHRQSQISWIKDIQPNVETNFGFVETYVDPFGTRAEYEGFVSMVNKEMTLKFDKLVQASEKFIPKLPWPKDMEKETFLKPDFTSLEVLAFATPGSPPLGINIPNYDDIRQDIGFKNVSLGNVLNAKSEKQLETFIRAEDGDLYTKYKGESFEVQVGLHELLGHGTGKLLMEESAGKYNFDIKNPPMNPLTKKPIETYYKPGETWGSVFKSISASYEECRAEAVAMHLCVFEEILSVFGHNGQEGEDVKYIAWLSMARAGLVALEFYDPASSTWGQAHARARFGILKVFLDCGLVSIDDDTNSRTGKSITLHREKIMSNGVPAIADFLTKLQVYKSTADVINGTKFYEDATSVSDSWIALRDIVIAHKSSRKIFVQGKTVLNATNDDAELLEYDETKDGMIKCFVENVYS